MFTIHLIYPPKYLGVRISQVFFPSSCWRLWRRSRNHMCKTVLNAQWTRIKRQPLKSSIVFPSSSTITPHLLKRKNMPESPKVKQKLKKQKQTKGTTMKNQHGFLLSSTESPATSNSLHRTLVSLSLSPNILNNFPIQSASWRKIWRKSWRKIQTELWIFLCVMWANSNNLPKCPLKR